MLIHKVKQLWQKNHEWLIKDILNPFIFTRLALLIVGWFSQYFKPSDDYFSQEIVQRTWEFTNNRLLDIWGRWDSVWYVSIIREGYFVRGDLNTVQSNLAFFPLYPYLVKFLALLTPSQSLASENLLIIGIILSNLFLLGALVILYKLTLTLFHNPKIAKLTIIYLLFFPTAFFFSAFYTESIFLFFSVASFYAAKKNNWGLAAMMGGLASLTRSPGVILFIPIILEYLKAHHWSIKKIRINILFLFFIPSTFLIFLINLYPLSGDILAPVKLQSAWLKETAMPWETIFNPNNVKPYLTSVDQIITIIFLVLLLISFFYLRLSLSLYAFILMLMPLTTGTLASVPRYCLVIFPIFILLGYLGNKKESLNQAIKIIFLTLQILFFTAWCQFYWFV